MKQVPAKYARIDTIRARIAVIRKPVWQKGWYYNYAGIDDWVFSSSLREISAIPI